MFIMYINIYQMFYWYGDIIYHKILFMFPDLQPPWIIILMYLLYNLYSTFHDLLAHVLREAQIRMFTVAMIARQKIS